jgi:putative membrane protein
VTQVLAAVLSALHLLALAIGLPAIVIRARALGGALDRATLRRALAADTAWGIAAALWLLTGPARAFGPFEKSATFYLASRLFYLKMALFLFVFALEIRPMVALIGWRRALARGQEPDLARAPGFARVSWIEAAVVVAIVFVASFMARGFGIGH